MAKRETDRPLRVAAGKLRHPATIQQSTRTPTASGDATTSWSTFATTYVHVLPLAGRDLWNAQQMQPDLSHQITCRYVPGVTSAMRLLVGSRVFNVAEPPEDIEERHILLRLLCIEVE